MAKKKGGKSRSKQVKQAVDVVAAHHHAGDEVSDWGMKVSTPWVAPARPPEAQPVAPVARPPVPVETSEPSATVIIAMEPEPATPPAAPAPVVDGRTPQERLEALRALSATTSGADRRVQARYPFRVKVSYAAVGLSAQETAENLSATGMFIHTATPLEVGDAVTVNFSLPGSSLPLMLAARVKWVSAIGAGASHGSGMGLEFTAMDDKKRTALSSVIARLKDGRAS